VVWDESEFVSISRSGICVGVERRGKSEEVVMGDGNGNGVSYNG
jgi:hypothetical protein